MDGKVVAIVDDMITGGTICRAAEALEIKERLQSMLLVVTAYSQVAISD